LRQVKLRLPSRTIGAISILFPSDQNTDKWGYEHGHKYCHQHVGWHADEHGHKYCHQHVGWHADEHSHKYCYRHCNEYTNQHSYEYADEHSGRHADINAYKFDLHKCRYAGIGDVEPARRFRPGCLHAKWQKDLEE